MLFSFSFKSILIHIMLRKRSSKESDESMASKWDQLRQYEDQVDDVMEREVEEVTEAVTVRTRLQQIKESSSRTFKSLKNQVSGIYR